MKEKRGGIGGVFLWGKGGGVKERRRERMREEVIILDRRLGEGEEGLEGRLSVKEKVEIGVGVEGMGVEVMEVGLEVCWGGDFE